MTINLHRMGWRNAGLQGKGVLTANSWISTPSLISILVNSTPSWESNSQFVFITLSGPALPHIARNNADPSTAVYHLLSFSSGGLKTHCVHCHTVWGMLLPKLRTTHHPNGEVFLPDNPRALEPREPHVPISWTLLALGTRELKEWEWNYSNCVNCSVFPRFCCMKITEILKANICVM